MKVDKITKKDIKYLTEKGWIQVRTIMEIVGKPKPHVSKTMKEYVETISKNSKIKLLKKDISLPKKHSGDLYSSFAELDILFDSLNELIYFCFDYMPSSIEIERPEQILYSSKKLTSFINDLQARLHDVDMGSKQLKQQNIKLNENLVKLMKNLIIVSSVNGKTLEELENISGIQKNSLQKVIDILIKEKKIKKQGKLFMPLNQW